jgi:hypothetical protein
MFIFGFTLQENVDTDDVQHTPEDLCSKSLILRALESLLGLREQLSGCEALYPHHTSSDIATYLLITTAVTFGTVFRRSLRVSDCSGRSNDSFSVTQIIQRRTKGW